MLVIVTLLGGLANASARQACEVVQTRLDVSGALAEELRCIPESGGLIGATVDCSAASCRMPDLPGYVRDTVQPWDEALFAARLRRAPAVTIAGSRRLPLPSRTPVVIWIQPRATSCSGFVAAADQLRRREMEAEAAHRDLGPHVFGKTRPTFRPVESGGLDVRVDADGHTRVSARRHFRADLTVMLPDPTTPPWPSPTPQETADWRRWCENVYWHELGHASLAEQLDSQELEIKGEGPNLTAALTSFLEDLQRRPLEAFLAVELPYDADTDHGRLQFTTVDFRCGS